MRRLHGFLLGLVMLAACGGAADLDDAPVPLGDFNLVHNVAVAPKAQRGPLSRPATEEQLAEAMRLAVAQRFDRYDGPRNYHFGVSVEGYNLAVPGVPLVVSPKSVLIINLTVWDDALGKKLNDEPEQITVPETVGTGAIVGSGYTLSAADQLTQRAPKAANAIERTLGKQREAGGW